jgi:anti-sigma-K factor RskA
VSGCSAYGGQIGGYVLRALDPGEMTEMERHLAGCAQCAQEVREVAGVPALLASIDPTDVPPPALSPAVEEAVLDRFVQERGRRRRARRRRLRLPAPTLPRLAALAAACAAAVVLALVLVSGDDDSGRAYASARLAPLDSGSRAAATAWADDVPAGTRVRLVARGLPVGGGATYELWCVRADGRWVSGGTFRAGRDGRAEAVLTAAVRPGDYHVMVVTRHAGDAPEGEHTPALLRGRLRY